MKRFIPDMPHEVTPVKPEDDFGSASKYKFISVGNHYLFYRSMLTSYRFIPLKSITRCYIRVDSCSGKFCCGRMYFDYRSLTLELQNGKQKRLMLDNEAMLRSIMAELKEKNVEIAIGYSPPPEQEEKPLSGFRKFIRSFKPAF